MTKYNIALKTAMLENGQKQMDVARAAKLSEHRLSRILRGYEEPRDAEKRALAKALKRTVAELFA